MPTFRTEELEGELLDCAAAMASGRALLSPSPIEFADLADFMREDVDDVEGPVFAQPLKLYRTRFTCMGAPCHPHKCDAAYVDEVEAVDAYRDVTSSDSLGTPFILELRIDGETVKSQPNEQFFLSKDDADAAAQSAVHGNADDWQPSTNWNDAGEIIGGENVEFLVMNARTRDGRRTTTVRASIRPDFQFQNYTSSMASYQADGPTH